ncbi:hypothetical protein D6817_03705 [Candidatus Pacearchaeota archaeon]|nr:MAG: hypothetical protein D6817_03705 [Candidatus Pacearchaeota archaeon]
MFVSAFLKRLHRIRLEVREDTRAVLRFIVFSRQLIRGRWRRAQEREFACFLVDCKTLLVRSWRIVSTFSKYWVT